MFRILLLAFFVSFVACAPWGPQDNPSIVDSQGKFVYSLDKLPTSAATASEPWSDTYWPSFMSGIAHRWQSQNPQDFQYQLNTLAQLKTMSADDIMKLSPAEKYDIFNQRYDYPTVHSEWQRTSPQDPQWEGICHGWAPASLSFAQPNVVELTNADGIKISFGSSDIKALLSYWVGQVDEEQASQWFIGSRCDIDIQANPSKENTTECYDINAGTFHVLISNMLGSQNSGFVIDRTRSVQVWNQPVFAYTSSVDHSNPTNPTVSMIISYGKETSPNYKPHDTYVYNETYTYTLELDGSGNIVGGEFLQWDRTDFAWMTQVNQFSGYWAALGTIYKASVPHSHAHSIRSLSTGVSTRGVGALVMTTSSGVLSHSYNSFEQNRVSDISVKHGGRFLKTSWSIKPIGDSDGLDGQIKYIELTFKKCHTKRHHDYVKVFEGSNGEGAMVAFVHGHCDGRKVKVMASSAYVVFVSDEPQGHHHSSSSVEINYQAY